MSKVYVPRTDKFALPLIGCTEYDLVDNSIVSITWTDLYSTFGGTQTTGSVYHAGVPPSATVTFPYVLGSTVDVLVVPVS